VTEDSLNDPVLQALEAQLAARVPSVSAAEQQEMLYQCAYAAGQQVGVRTLRRWQATAGALAALVLAVSLPQWAGQQHLAVQPPAVPPAPVVVEKTSPGSATVPDPVVQVPDGVRKVQLDAWQMPRSNDRLNPMALAQNDAEARANSVRSLTQEFLR
jgi:hypothetical protein